MLRYFCITFFSPELGLDFCFLITNKKSYIFGKRQGPFTSKWNDAGEKS